MFTNMVSLDVKDRIVMSAFVHVNIDRTFSKSLNCYCTTVVLNWGRGLGISIVRLKETEREKNV